MKKGDEINKEGVKKWNEISEVEWDKWRGDEINEREVKEDKINEEVIKWGWNKRKGSKMERNKRKEGKMEWNKQRGEWKREQKWRRDGNIR